MKVKICGIKRIEDAKLAIDLGADAIGLLVGQQHASNDFIDEERAKSIVDELPPFCSSILVTHLKNNEEIIDLAHYIGVSTIQLHGDSLPEDARYIKKRVPNVKLIKSLHVIDKDSVKHGRKYLNDIDAILLDTINNETGQVGGTGITHDWSLSKKIVSSYDKPVILAGGLSPDNIREAIQAVKPFGVDVNSGTKGEDGHRDAIKMNNFIKLAKNY